MYLQAGVSKRLGAGSHNLKQGIKENKERNIAQLRDEPGKKRKWKLKNEREKNARPRNPPHQCPVLDYQIIRRNHHWEDSEMVVVFLIEHLSR
jgi:hypothetical protein